MNQVASPVVRESDLVPAPQGPEWFTVRSVKQGVEGRLQVQPDGSIGWNTVENSTGEWEVGKKIGAKIVWSSPSAYPTRAFALPLAEGI